MEFEVLRNRNDWLNNYKGQTFTDKLQNEITDSLFQEHSKYKQTISLKILLDKIPSLNWKQKKLILKTAQGDIIPILEKYAKKSIVVCIEPNTREILSLGGSSLLKNLKENRIEDNMILDNFGNLFAGLFVGTAGGVANATLKDDGGTSRTLRVTNQGASTSSFLQNAGAPPGVGTQIRMGSGTAIARSDNKIDNALANAPESGYIDTNLGAYTSNNTIVYQGDANPTGGAGTVNEAGSFGVWVASGLGPFSFMITHDFLNPGVVYVAGKLLRCAYSWQI